MITDVIVRRPLFGREIRQKMHSGYFSANDLSIAGNSWRVANGYDLFYPNQWFQKDATKEFIAALDAELGVPCKIAKRGNSGETWVHPFLFIDMALAISPKLKIETYKWLYDELLRYRNDSGDSYKRMCGALWVNATNKTEFPHYIKDVANKIQTACGVLDWSKAGESALKMRDKIHTSISTLANVLRRNDEAVRLGIIDATGDIKQLT